MISFLSLSSGSSGNCYFFTDGQTSFLIDAGVGPRSCAKKLSEYGFSLSQVEFILVTHDHIDHVKALGIISSKYHKPVYTTNLLKQALLHNVCTRGYLSGNVHVIEPGKATEICGVGVLAFEVPHDATQTVGFHLCFGGRRITLITDCGRMSEPVMDYALRSDTLILESNYDMLMLENGPYTALLKDRIRGGMGHLSNDEAAGTLVEALRRRIGRLEQVFLCHLSDNNNTPQAALQTSLKAISDAGLSENMPLLETLPRGKASRLYTL